MALLKSVVLLQCVALLGCGAQIGSTSSSLALPDQSLLQAPECTRQPDAKGAKLYECSTENGPMYVTTLQNCSIPEKFTFQAMTRELLVGVMNLEVLRQEPVELSGHKALHSMVRGIVDVDPVRLSAFTFRHDECVTDLVMWEADANGAGSDNTGSNNTGAGSSDAFSGITTRLAERLITSPLVSGEPSHAGG